MSRSSSGSSSSMSSAESGSYKICPTLGASSDSAIKQSDIVPRYSDGRLPILVYGNGTLAFDSCCADVKFKLNDKFCVGSGGPFVR